MISVQLVPGGKTGKFAKGTLLLDAMQDMGLTPKTPCGGKGICGKCRTRIAGELSGVTAVEKKVLNNDPGTRLACQAKISGNVRIFIDENRVSGDDAYPAVNPGDRFAVAADIGTTSVNLSLVNLPHRKIFKLASFLNPQRRFGHDVISRIAAANDPAVRQSMTRQIRQIIFSSIATALKAMGIPFPNIEKIVFSGNTTMLYLLFGMDVSRLGRYPFKTECLDFNDFTPSDISADLFPNARIFAMPAASAFLGGDFVGGLNLCHEKGFYENTFFIDLGTNGELFLINGAKKIFAASCAMGPALEGMNISCGMTADSGSVTHVEIDSGILKYRMISPGPPVGITGTALIDIVSIFLAEGIILDNGAFSADLQQRPLPHPARFSDGLKSKQICLWDDISISQRDVRNLQLAKGAGLTASRLILEAAGCSPEKVSHVLIAGAFGTHLDLDNFRRLGFIPEFPNAEFHFLGNTSLAAAASACADHEFLKDASHMRDQVKEVDLAAHPAFSSQFISALNF